jgi:ribosomal protein S18 acetylase RimI-like enzyme
MPIEVVPATPERWDDVVEILGKTEAGCWCQAPRGREAGRPDKDSGLRRRLLREQLDEDPPAGMLAYLDGVVVGWLGFGRRDRLPRLQRSRTIPAVDDRPVWSVLCFNVRPGYRRRGIATALLDGLITYAEASGAPGLEAYPIDPGGQRVDSTFGFVGLTGWFERAGFERVVETDAHSARRPRILMRRMR